MPVKQVILHAHHRLSSPELQPQFWQSAPPTMSAVQAMQTLECFRTVQRLVSVRLQQRIAALQGQPAAFM